MSQAFILGVPWSRAAFYLINYIMLNICTYGHRLKNNRHPVRSAKDKLQIDQLVVGWVTTSEYWLLYVNFLFCIYIG